MGGVRVNRNETAAFQTELGKLITALCHMVIMYARLWCWAVFQNLAKAEFIIPIVCCGVDVPLLVR